MEQLKRWADHVCMCAHFVRLPPSLSANEFEGAGRQAEAKVFTIMCATEKRELQTLSHRADGNRNG